MPAISSILLKVKERINSHLLENGNDRSITRLSLTPSSQEPNKFDLQVQTSDGVARTISVQSNQLEDTDYLISQIIN